MSKETTGHEPSAEAPLQATLARNLRAARKSKGLTQVKGRSDRSLQVHLLALRKRGSVARHRDVAEICKNARRLDGYPARLSTGSAAPSSAAGWTGRE